MYSFFWHFMPLLDSDSREMAGLLKLLSKMKTFIFAQTNTILLSENKCFFLLMISEFTKLKNLGLS